MGRPVMRENESLPAPHIRQLTYITLKWVAIWLFAGGVLNYLIMPFGIDYFNRYYLTALYFTFCGILGAVYYRLDSLFEHHDTARVQFLMIASFTALILAGGLLVNLYFPIDDMQAKKIQDSKLVFPLFYTSTWMAKVADVAFQQVFIFALLKELKATGLEHRKIILLFSFAFGILHLPLLILLGWSGLYFILPSLFAGFIFSYVILRYRRGVFYSFAVHMAFYFALGIVLRYFR